MDAQLLEAIKRRKEKALPSGNFTLSDPTASFSKTPRSETKPSTSKSNVPKTHVEGHKEFIKMEDSIHNFVSENLCGKDLRKHQTALFARAGLEHKHTHRIPPQHLANYHKKIKKQRLLYEKKKDHSFDSQKTEIHHFASIKTLEDVRRKQKFIAIKKDRLSRK
ncbi:hypothetical protein RCL1_001104 [Eukaryota sp. TZLM3-RCL]